MAGGVSNELGWTYAAMIVDASGELRTQGFSGGRDPTVSPVRNVPREVDGRTQTGVTGPLLAH